MSAKVDESIAKVDQAIALSTENKKEIVSVSKRVSNLESSRSQEVVIQESTRRLSRLSNVIFHNVEETGDPTDDLQLATELLSDTECSNSVSEVLRLGNEISDNKPRPLKVCMTNPRKALWLLKNKTTVAALTSKNITVSDDKTEQQRNNLSKLREELNDRIAEGERNLTIKYIQGIPSIVKNRTPKN